MSRHTLDAVADVLDHEIVDADGMPCGMVDDVMLEGRPGAPLAIVALLVGPGAWLPRTMQPLRFIAGLLFRRARVRVPWSAVDTVGERIVLAERAVRYGLGRVDRRLGRVLARIPGGDRAPE
jgi:sporulation protein YlmC with PRC-barrel domain